MTVLLFFFIFFKLMRMCRMSLPSSSTARRLYSVPAKRVPPFHRQNQQSRPIHLAPCAPPGCLCTAWGTPGQGTHGAPPGARSRLEACRHRVFRVPDMRLLRTHTEPWIGSASVRVGCHEICRNISLDRVLALTSGGCFGLVPRAKREMGVLSNRCLCVVTESGK